MGLAPAHGYRLVGTCMQSEVWLGFGFGAWAGLGRVFGSGAERMLAGAQRTPTGAERAPDAGLGSGAGRRRLTGASMTQRPTCPRGPCSRSRGPTTWRPKASWRCRRLARAAAPVVGRPVPFPQGGRAEALPPRVASVHPGSASITRRDPPNNGLVTMLPAGEWWRPRDARRPRPVGGRLLPLI